MKKVGECHPLLSGKSMRKEHYNHGFSSAQIQELSAICETLIPPMPQEFDFISEEIKGRQESDALEHFNRASGSEPPLPEEVAELLVERGLPRIVTLVSLTLSILSFRLGTLLLCGVVCLDWKWPFIHNFSEIPLESREQILQSWSSSYHWYLIPLRAFFTTIKQFCFYNFFSRTEGNEASQVCKAIGYEDDVRNLTPQIQEHKTLRKGIIDTTSADDSTIFQSLIQHGLRVDDSPEKDTYRIVCDVVIIGSGCGGGVAAGVLACSGYKVVVLEKGNHFIPEEYSNLEGPSMNRLYEAGGLLTTTDGQIMIMAGSTVGGGSTINCSAALRTPSSVLKSWSKDHKISFFAGPEYQSAMDVVCKRIGVTQNCRTEDFQNTVLRKGCENLGLGVESVPRNSMETHSCSTCTYGCKTGEKHGTDSTWLVDAVNQGAVILTGCKANKLIIKEDRDTRKGKKCLGVIATVLSENVTKELQILAEVTVSSCGALLTPPLMMTSGLKNPNIGKNLHLHPLLFAWGYFPDHVSEIEGKAFQGGTITCLHQLFSEESQFKAVLEHYPMGPATFAAMFPWISGMDMKAKIMKYARIATIFVLVGDKSSGEVQAEHQIQYYMEQFDKEIMVTGLRQALKILVAAGAVEVGIFRNDGLSMKCIGMDDEEVEEFLNKVTANGGPMSYEKYWNVYASAHQMGSCRMGATENEGAVDENGQSWEADGLYACDGSVLPSAVGINPMVTIQSTAYCISKKIAETLK